MTLRPMLADTAAKQQLDEAITSPDWVMQRKLDGDRFLVHITDGKLVVLNRGGQMKVTNIARSVIDSFAVFTAGTWTFDGEVVGRKLSLFDMVAAGDQLAPDAPFEDRHLVLTELVKIMAVDPDVLDVVSCASTSADKQALLDEAKDKHWEGVILRHRQGRYQQGPRRSTKLLKFKFVTEADFIVVDRNVGGKNNAVVALIDLNRADPIVKCGTISCNGKGDVRIGSVWSARFLYVQDPAHPSLVQPRLLKCRDGEKGPEECLIDQLVDAWTDKI